jgi:hypothetical protein
VDTVGPLRVKLHIQFHRCIGKSTSALLVSGKKTEKNGRGRRGEGKDSLNSVTVEARKGPRAFQAEQVKA